MSQLLKKQDIRHAVDALKMDITDSRIADARQRAQTIKDEIDRNLTRINGVAVQITGSTAEGADVDGFLTLTATVAGNTRHSAKTRSCRPL
jgi:hypothetical protein